jgi:acetyltransferase-like isoleucine patch superfamily enzyme
MHPPADKANILEKLGKAGAGFLKRPLPCLFYLADQVYDGAVLPLMSNLWVLEATARGAKVGRGLLLGRPVLKFHPLSEIILEDGFSLISAQRRCSSGNLYGPCRIHTHSATSRIHIGKNVGLNGTSIVARSRSVSIGRDSMLAPNCVVMDSPFHKIWPPEQREWYPASNLDQDVSIGSNCWIGAGCIILAGSRIGNNSVIGARSVVSGEIPANCLALGSPAKIVRKLDE